ncbi:MAG: PucR family transcriptional regulator [Candidatus Dormibacteria bacterium]
MPTVAEVLELPELSSGRPQVIAGQSRLDNQVRWVHVSELTDISRLLSGGELLLTTGIALDTSQPALVQYVRSLAAARVAGLVVELGRKFGEVPSALAQTAELEGLPLILLRREVKFVQVTQEAHAFIIESQLEELRFRQTIHEAFTEMAMEGAAVPDIVRYASTMAQRPMLLEDRVHQVVSFESGGFGGQRLLQEWRLASPSIPVSGRTQFERGSPSWLVTPVGARGEIWARLAVRMPDGPVAPRVQAILERAAVALALNRLVERDRLSLEVQAQRSLLNDMTSGVQPTPMLATRAASLDFVVENRTLIGGQVRWQDAREVPGGVGAEARTRDLGERLAAAAEAARVKLLMAPLPDGSVRILVGCPRATDAAAALRSLAQAVHGSQRPPVEPDVVICFGTAVDSIRYARWTLQEAEQVMDALGEPVSKLYYELPDIHLRGLLHLLREDERLQTFWERELGPLVEADLREGGDLIRVLESYLEHAGNKVSAATALGLSRPTLYARLERIEALLGRRISDVESLLSLHVALLARRSAGVSGAGPSGGQGGGGAPTFASSGVPVTAGGRSTQPTGGTRAHGRSRRSPPARR